VPLLGNINTNSKDALSIAAFAKGLKTVVNIIPWNPVEGLVFQGKPLCQPNKKEIQDFIKTLENSKLKVTTRYGKGSSVMGACGQLGSSVKSM
jgi:23S rRNA (adenine2503-C2)-methyltransferase